MSLFIISTIFQALGLASILWAIESIRHPAKKNRLADTKFSNIIWGIINLFLGIALLVLFGITGWMISMWTVFISIPLTLFLYFYLPKTKVWKNRGKAKQPIEDGTNLMFRLIGQGIMLVGAGHILFPIYVWLRSGVWTTIALGDWGFTILKLNELGRFDTGWWAFNKVLNYIILDQSAALPLVVIGYIIYVSASDD